MSKIALLATELATVETWRRQSGINIELAPWVVSINDAREWWPFMSVLCLAEWDTGTNRAIRDYIIERIALEAPSPVSAVDEIEQIDAPVSGIREPVDGVRPRPNAEWPTPPTNEQESLMRRFGVNPGLIGMLNDETRNSLCTQINSNEIQARHTVDDLGRIFRIRAWSTPVQSDPVRNTLINTIEGYLGATYHDDFMNMSQSQLATFVPLARRAMGAHRHGDTALETQLRNELNSMLIAAREEYTAGFMAEPSIPPAAPSLTSRRPTPAPRPFVDPLRDHLRAYMRDAAAEDAERRSSRRSREQRRVAEDEERFRRLNDED